jgi:tight adherence protein B
MKLVILILGLFSSFFFFFSLFQMLFFSNKRMEKRIKHYLSTSGQKTFDRKSFNFFVQFQVYKQKLRRQMNTKKNNKLDTMLQQAGVPLKPEEFVMFQWMSIVISGGVLYFISGNIVSLSLGCGVGFFLPKLWISKKKRSRILRFNDALPDIISTIVGSLRAGFSFPQALKTVAEEADSPVKEEIEMVIREMQYGSSLDDALEQLKERMPSEDLDLMIQAILIQKQVGGNLATILDTIVQTIRDRNKIQRQILTLTAQGRLSGIIIGLLPVVLGILLYLIEPDYIGRLFTDPLGIAMLIAGTTLGIIGLVSIRKLTTIEV